MTCPSFSVPLLEGIYFEKHRSSLSYLHIWLFTCSCIAVFSQCEIQYHVYFTAWMVPHLTMRSSFFCIHLLSKSFHPFWPVLNLLDSQDVAHLLWSVYKLCFLSLEKSGSHCKGACCWGGIVTAFELLTPSPQSSCLPAFITLESRPITMGLFMCLLDSSIHIA